MTDDDKPGPRSSMTQHGIHKAYAAVLAAGDDRDKAFEAMVSRCGLQPPGDFCKSRGYGRRSGRTTYALLQALLDAEAGHPVLFIANRSAHAHHRLLLDRLAASAGVDIEKVDIVTVRNAEIKSQGRRDIVLVYDHHYLVNGTRP